MLQVYDKKLNYDYSKWYEKIYPEMTDYGMWLRGNEINTMPREEYDLRGFRVLFVRLSTYKDVATSFTHLLLYEIASSIPSIYADIAYLPPEKDAKIFEEYNIPWLLGTQTKFGPEGFSLIGFSNSIVQEVLNIPKFLETSGIPLKKKERLKRDDIPIIILGGSNAIYTTSIWGEDTLLDGVFTGRDGFYIKRLFEICADGRKNGKSKNDILYELEDIPGFHPTDAPKRISKSVETTASNDIYIFEKGIVSYNEKEIGSSYLQISEGCRAFCGFCAENWNRKPYKELSTSFLLKKALKMKSEMGLEKIDFFSFNFNMHSEFYKLLWTFLPFFKNIGLKSQRFDMLAGEQSMLEYQVAAGKSTFSCGLEGISARLRRYLNKNLDDNALFESLGLIFKTRPRRLKIFLISTGMEEDKDFKEFDKFLDKIKQNMQRFNVRTRVIFSITPLVKFPWTPLEFGKSYSPEMHDRVIEKMKQYIKSYRFEVREAMGTDEYLISQILTRGSDERIISVLLRTLHETNFIYYRRITPHFFNSFMRNFEKENIKAEELLSDFTFDESMRKLWASMEINIDRGSLWDIYKKNIGFVEIGASLDKIKIQRPQFSHQEYKEMIRKIKDDEVKKSFYVTFTGLGRGIFRKYAGLVLARALMKSEKSLIPYFRYYVSSHWSKDDSKPLWVIGDDIVVLMWDRKAISILEEKLKEPDFVELVNTNLDKWGKLRMVNDESEIFFRLHIDLPHEFNGLDYFRKKGLKYTLYKNKPGSYYLKFTNESLKKKIISEFSYSIKDDSNKISIDMTPGIKFDVEDFIRKAFVYQQKNDWVRTMVYSIIEEEGRDR